VPNDRHPKTFLISPIGEAETSTRKKADQTLKHRVMKALQPEPLNCKIDRADEDTDPGSITPRMINLIMTADLVVIDLTDQNPNVFYEMAIAHGYRRPVHIITEGQKIPFDVQHARCQLRPGKPLDEAALGRLIDAAFADISARIRTASR
jgi:nucleoside 2-deoxyribosyltransferase